jgi:3-oxoisoapionate decarboxylase
MRLGVGSYTWPWAVGVDGYPRSRPLSALAILERAQALGVEVVQLCDNLPVGLLSDTDRRQLRTVARSSGLCVQLGTRGCLPDHLRQQLAWCAQVGAGLLRVVLDDGADQPPLAAAEERLRAVLPDLGRSGVILAIENHDRFRAAELAGLVTRLESRHVGVCLDTANSFGALEGPEAILAVLRPHVVNLHVKDFVVRRQPHQLGFVIEGAPAGEGRLDLAALLRGLPAVEAIVEQWTPPAGDLEETVAREADWAVRSVRNLKHLL